MRGRVFERYATADGHMIELRYVVPDDDPLGDGVQATCTGCPAIHGPDSQELVYDWVQEHAVECGAREKAGVA